MKLLSFKVESHSSDIVNSMESRTNDLIKAPSPDNFHKWDIPKVNIETIYKIGTFSFQIAFSIKTHEEIVSLQNGIQTIPLIKPEAIQIHLKDEFPFMHIGLVQVAVKPFIRKGINAPIYMALRDKRLKKYKSSLLAMINTNIHNRPILFNCYPDFCVHLTCQMTLEALKIDVHVQGDEFHDFNNFAIMCKVYFRLLSTNLNTKFLNPSPSNSKETVLLQIKDDKPQVCTLKLKFVLQNFSNGMRLQFQKKLSLKTLNLLLLTNQSK